MIYFTPGITQSIWMSLRESVGATTSFKFTLTNDISGEVKDLYPQDLQPNNPWSRFEIKVDKPESLPNIVNLNPGMWSFKVEVASEIIETGKILVKENKNWTKIDRPAKNVKVLRR
jgi:hypothetical protein